LISSLERRSGEEGESIEEGNERGSGTVVECVEEKDGPEGGGKEEEEDGERAKDAG